MQVHPNRHQRADNAVHASTEATGTLWHWSQLGTEVRFCRDVVTKPQTWQLLDSRHTIIVHLGGRIESLETELEGRGGSLGPPLPGEIWAIPGSRRYASYLSGDTAEYAMLSISPSPSDLDVDSSSKIAPVELKAVEGIPDPVLHRQILELALWHNVTSGGDLESTAIEALVDGIRNRIRAQYSHDSRRPGTPRYKIVLNARQARRMRQYVHAHLSEPLTLSELAAEARQGEHQFHRAFQATFGTSPWQYLIRQRLRRVQHLLATTSKDITTLAHETGFSSHSHLTSTFNRHIGRSPSSYREMTKS